MQLVEKFKASVAVCSGQPEDCEAVGSGINWNGNNCYYETARLSVSTDETPLQAEINGVALFTKTGRLKTRYSPAERLQAMGATECDLDCFIELFCPERPLYIETKSGSKNPRDWTTVRGRLPREKVIKHLAGDLLPRQMPRWIGAKCWGVTRCIVVDVDYRANKPDSFADFNRRCRFVREQLARARVPSEAILESETPSGGRHFRIILNRVVPVERAALVCYHLFGPESSGEFEFFPKKNKGIRLPFSYLPGRKHDANDWVRFVRQHRDGDGATANWQYLWHNARDVCEIHQTVIDRIGLPAWNKLKGTDEGVRVFAAAVDEWGNTTLNGADRRSRSLPDDGIESLDDSLFHVDGSTPDHVSSKSGIGTRESSPWYRRRVERMRRSARARWASPKPQSEAKLVSPFSDCSPTTGRGDNSPASDRYTSLLRKDQPTRAEMQELFELGISAIGTRVEATKRLSWHLLFVLKLRQEEVENQMVDWVYRTGETTSNDVINDLRTGQRQVEHATRSIVRSIAAHDVRQDVGERDLATLSEAEVEAVVTKLGEHASDVTVLTVAIHFLRYSKIHGLMRANGWEAAVAVHGVIRKWPGCRSGNRYRPILDTLIGSGLVEMTKEKIQRASGKGRARTYFVSISPDLRTGANLNADEAIAFGVACETKARRTQPAPFDNSSEDRYRLLKQPAPETGVKPESQDQLETPQEDSEEIAKAREVGKRPNPTHIFRMRKMQATFESLARLDGQPLEIKHLDPQKFDLLWSDGTPWAEWTLAARNEANDRYRPYRDLTIITSIGGGPPQDSAEQTRRRRSRKSDCGSRYRFGPSLTRNVSMAGSPTSDDTS